MKNIFIFVAAALIAVTSASAKGECKADREKLCGTVQKGDHKAMHECMKMHEGEVSEPCKAHRAQNREKSKEIKKACKADYKKLCKEVKPGEGRIIQCLNSKQAELSQSCKDALANTNIEH